MYDFRNRIKCRMCQNYKSWASSHKIYKYYYPPMFNTIQVEVYNLLLCPALQAAWRMAMLGLLRCDCMVLWPSKVPQDRLQEIQLNLQPLSLDHFGSQTAESVERSNFHQ